MTDVSDNTIDGKKQKKTINNELKQKHKDLKQNFRYLQDMVQNKVKMGFTFTV